MRHVPVLAASVLLSCAHPPPPPLARPDSDLRDIERLENLRDGGDAIARFLRSSDSSKRRRAALALGRMADETTFPALRAALGDPDPAVRAEVAFAIGMAADEGGADALLARLDLEGDPEAIGADLEALGRVGGVKGLPALARAVGDGRAPVREGALRGLVFVAQSKKPIDSATVQALAAARSAKIKIERFLAVYALSRLPIPDHGRAAAQAALRAELPDDDDETLAMRLKALGKVAEPADGAIFGRALAHADWRVRIEAARGMAASGPDAADWLAEWAVAAKDGSPHVLPTVLEALGPYASRPRVFAAAGKLAPRCEATALLERAGQRAATLVCDGEPSRRKILHAQVLGSLPAVEPMLRPIPPSAGQTVAPPLDVPTRLAELALLLRDPDPRVRAAAVSAVAEIDAPATSGLLREALRETDVGVVDAAAEGIRRNAEAPRRRPDPDATPLLIAALGKLTSAAAAEEMIAILGALGASGDPRAIPMARWAREDPNFSVRKAAREALGALGDKDAPPPKHPPPPLPTPGDADAVADRTIAATIGTNRGEIEIRFYPADAPYAVASLVYLTGARFFQPPRDGGKGLTFHRVVPDFVIQGGDPRGDGNGGPDYTLRCEYSRRRFGRGSVGIAHAGRDTGGSQLFITHAPTPHLDGRYTLVGEVVRGQDVVDQIVVGDWITSFTITIAGNGPE